MKPAQHFTLAALDRDQAREWMATARHWHGRDAGTVRYCVRIARGHWRAYLAHRAELPTAMRPRLPHAIPRIGF